MLRRRFVMDSAAMAVGASGVVAAACSGPGGSGTGGSGQQAPTIGAREVTLSWEVEMQPDVLSRVPAFLAEWTQKYPRVKIDAQHFDGGDGQKIQKMLTLAAAGTPVDVVGKLTYIQPLAAPGGALPLEPLIKRDKYDVSKYNKGWLTSFGTHQDKLYSLPYGMGGSAMVWVYNRAHFQEVGLKEPSADWKNPWTWEEFRQAAIRLTKRDGDTIARAGVEQFGNQFYSLPYPWGGQWLKADHKTSAADAPEMVEAYTRYLDLIFKDRVTTISPDGENLGALHNRFYDGKVSIHYILGSRLPAFTDPAVHKVDYAMAPFPKGTLPSSPAASGDIDTNQLALGSQKTVEESWAFTKWLLEKARYAIFSDRMPTLTEDASAWAKEAFKRVPATARVDVLVNAIASARPNDPVRSHVKVDQISSEAMTPAWNDMRTQKVAVKDALAEAKRKIQGIVGS
jgi:multiple sugar transport system substrate-binding protein